MRTIWKVEKNGKVLFFAANITASVVRLEKEYNCVVDATIFGDDAWGRQYFAARNIKIYDLKGIRKELSR